MERTPVGFDPTNASRGGDSAPVSSTKEGLNVPGMSRVIPSRFVRTRWCGAGHASNSRVVGASDEDVLKTLPLRTSHFAERVFNFGFEAMTQWKCRPLE